MARQMRYPTFVNLNATLQHDTIYHDGVMQAAAPSCFVQSHFGFHHHRSTYHERAGEYNSGSLISSAKSRLGMVKEIIVHAGGTRYMQYTCSAERPDDTAPGDDEALALVI